jgi:hypothetical protein
MARIRGAPNEYMRFSWMPLGAEVARNHLLRAGFILPRKAAGNGIEWIMDVSWAAEHLGLGGGIRRWGWISGQQAFQG